MEQLIAGVKAKGDTVGGIITCVIKGCPRDWASLNSKNSMQCSEPPC